MEHSEDATEALDLGIVVLVHTDDSASDVDPETDFCAVMDFPAIRQPSPGRTAFDEHSEASRRADSIAADAARWTAMESPAFRCL